MYDVFYNSLKPSVKNLQLNYMDSESFVLSFSECKISDEHMDLTNLDTHKNNEEVPCQFIHEFETKHIEDFVALLPNTYSFKYCVKSKTKEKRTNKCNNA